jgi:hypothetical protein
MASFFKKGKVRAGGKRYLKPASSILSKTSRHRGDTSRRISRTLGGQCHPQLSKEIHIGIWPDR